VTPDFHDFAALRPRSVHEAQVYHFTSSGIRSQAAAALLCSPIVNEIFPSAGLRHGRVAACRRL
jgi:hypothetical protein